MSAKIFKNFKHARRRLSEVFLCIQAVDKELKPSYLWDAFAAAASEVQSYVDELHLLRLIDHRLKVLCIDDTVFVAHYENLKRYLDNFSFAGVDLVNVSQTLSLPYVVGGDEKTEILEPILKCSREILEADYVQRRSIDYTSCNPCTLFGVLLGYPVLYWFSHQSAHSEFKCLAMLPLKVHKVVTGVSLPDSFLSKAYFSSKAVPACHELFNFSIPENVSKETELLVENWFHVLAGKSESNTVFRNLQIKTNVIALPTVSM